MRMRCFLLGGHSHSEFVISACRMREDKRVRVRMSPIDGSRMQVGEQEDMSKKVFIYERTWSMLLLSTENECRLSPAVSDTRIMQMSYRTEAYRISITSSRNSADRNVAVALTCTLLCY